MSTDNTVRTTIVPAHGGGRIAPFRPGEFGNPGGRPTALREVRALCRTKSMMAAEALIDVVGRAKERDSRGMPIEDGRVVVVAAQTILTWAYGKPPDYDPNEDKGALRIDTSVLATAEKELLLSFMRRGLVNEAPAEAPAEIEGEGGGRREGACRRAAVYDGNRRGALIAAELDPAAAGHLRHDRGRAALPGTRLGSARRYPSLSPRPTRGFHQSLTLTAAPARAK